MGNVGDCESFLLIIIKMCIFAMMTGAIAVISCCTIDAIYSYDMMINNNMYYAPKGLGSADQYLTLLICAATVYCIFVMFFTKCLPILKSQGLFGYFGSMFFWPSVISLAFINALLRPKSIDIRCNNECTFNSLHNGHLNAMWYLLICVCIVSVILMWKAGMNIYDNNFLNWMFLWYMFFPVLYYFLFLLFCFNPEQTQPLSEKDSHTEMIEV